MADEGNETVADGCSNLRQGDVLLTDATIEDLFEGSLGGLGAAVLSQTCDVVQSSKTRCILAPIITVDNAEIVSSKKGRKPLHLYLGTDQVGEERVADLEHMTSVPKSLLEGKTIVGRHVSEISGRRAGEIAARIGRTFNRFPFPDEVYPVFRELRARVQSKAGTPSPFGQVVDLADDLRVSSDQWMSPGRALKLYVVVPVLLIGSVEDLDPGWSWSATDVAGAGHQDVLEQIDLNRACELLLANLDGRLDVLAALWARIADRLSAELVAPYLDEEVPSCEVVVLSDAEFTYRDYVATESLDLEVLSDSHDA